MASSVKVNKITPTTSCGTVTLGDSGDTISIPSGASLNIGGTVSGIEGIVNWDTTAKTSGFTAVAGNGYFVNTTSAPITVTLPATPSAGDLVGVKDYALTAQTNNITLARNGSNIQGTANDFIINTQGRSVTLIYVDGTQGWMITGASQASDIVSPLFVTATGGTITTCGNYKIHTFTGPGTFTVSCAGNPSGSTTVDYLVVAGGGGGGGGYNSPVNRGAGAGGAGGWRASSGTASGCYTAGPAPLTGCVAALPVTATGYPITVGGGGQGGHSPLVAPQISSPGSNSIFSTITSTGGGNGGSSYSPTPESIGSPGGSGGGGSAGGVGGACAGAGNTPPVSPPQGQPGGGGNTGPDIGGHGGGGIGGAGVQATTGNGGAGGAGVTSCITASPISYAGGGGGGAGNATGGPASGGGGAGANFPNGDGNPGTVNTGGGGGGGAAGSGTIGGAGGSGIVVIRYKYQ